jgi:hypothetical protein
MTIVTKTKPIAYDRNDKRHQLWLPSSEKKPIDHTQLHQSQSIRYNRYRSIMADMFAPSASCDYPQRANPFAPSASCDYPRGADPFASSASCDYPPRADLFSPSASCDYPRRVDPFAPSASCDRLREDNQLIVTAATTTSQALSLRSAV